ncbi:MAG: SpoIIE family protein phosphatase [Candidatus Sumerlaeota bacterium]|nr:SpoIIE family protein phosphatase [Candidatus Sumerlaeota bacterium]
MNERNANSVDLPAGRVLVADDDAPTRRMVSSLLAREGYQVIEAVDGMDCMDKVRRHRPDILLLDWVMPRMDGLETCRRLREQRRFDALHIIILTVKSNLADKILALDTGADDFLTKPFHREELLARMRSAQRIQTLNHELSDVLAQLRQDIIAATSVQRAMLPHGPVELAPLKFAWDFIPAESIAGDLFDVFRADENHAAFYMFDVSGHGVAPAMLSVSLHRSISPGPLFSSLIKTPLDQPPYYCLASPADVAGQLNRHFQMSSNGLYFTLFYGLINCQTLRMRYCRAGQTPPFVVRGDRIFALEEGDIPVGLVPEASFSEHEFQFEPGDRMALYSDGLIEGDNPQEEPFEARRARQCLFEARKGNIEEMIGALIKAFRQWRGDAPLQDDISILAMEVKHNEKP